VCYKYINIYIKDDSILIYYNIQTVLFFYIIKNNYRIYIYDFVIVRMQHSSLRVIRTYTPIFAPKDETLS